MGDPPLQSACTMSDVPEGNDDEMLIQLCPLLVDMKALAGAVGLSMPCALNLSETACAMAPNVETTMFVGACVESLLPVGGSVPSTPTSSSRMRTLRP